MTDPVIAQPLAGPQGPSGPQGITGGGFTVVKVAAANANTSFVVPAGNAIAAIYIEETANHAITGGVDIGTTDGGADVVSAIAVGAHGLITANADSVILKRLFSMSVDTTIFFDAHTAWNSAVVNVQIFLHNLN